VGATANPPAAVESRSLLLEAGGATLLSANFDGGSVSRIDRATGARLAEAPVGGDITSLTVDGADGLIGATDYTGNRVLLLASQDLKLKTSIAIAGRPAGIVYDARNRVFWVAATEANRLYAIAPDGTVKLDLTVAESPRGLALLSDGRLLVSHAFIGAVSIYDTTTSPPKLAKLITLASSQNPDETVSQGLPRVLDRIAVSPDGKQAWLPHELWNFDHPFQFQSTIFPAISVIALKPGDEHEAVPRRMQLFKQINIIENGNQTRIVSNPADVAFSDDGAKAYVTMAGSEDLVVFDLARALPIDSESPKAATTDGAHAVEIFRHLPGENPRGLVVAGDDIYVQNAMGLDLSKLSTGGSGSFARVKVVSPSFAKLVAHDPLPPQVRRGERIFNLGNTAEFPDAPLAGNNWMSCQSCHVDGFNFSNRALFAATPVDKFHSSFTGHGTIANLVAGDFVGDYIRMIRDTQGGMGADTRFATPETDPAHPSPAVVAMMNDLHAYVTSAGNLPLLATWLRGEDGGPAVAAGDLMNSAVCASCHSRIFKEWSNSTHRMMAQSDPYYVVLEDLAAKTEGEGFRAWCMGCHAPEALLSGATRTTASPSHMFDRDGAALFADLKSYARAIDNEGPGCLFCHRVEKLEDAGGLAGGNASLNVSLADRPLYPGETSDIAALRTFAGRLIRAKPDVHAASLMGPAVKDPKLCASCHEEFAPGTGAYITDTWQEWAASSFNAPNDPVKNRTCFDCHMHADVASIGKPVPGQDTDGGPLEPDVSGHAFIGAQYHLVGLRDPAMAAQSIALLKTAAKLTVSDDGSDRFTVRVANVGAGHALPTGVSDFRELWLEITATDATGAEVFSSGVPNAAGDVPGSARIFRKVLADKDGHLAGLQFWQLGKFASDTRIPADGHRDEAFALPPTTAYPVRVSVRLMFRTFPQWITDLVRVRFPAMPPPKPVAIADVTATLGNH
jgi:DNA-binding beta-propeller fold protein YncE